MDLTSPFTALLPASTVYETIGDALVPWRCTALEEEYAALRGRAAIIDLTGCGLIAVDGPGADELMIKVFTREVEFLSPETSVMGLLLDEDARPIDLVTVYRTDAGFLVETAVGRGLSTLAYLGAHAGADVELRPVTNQALFGFEGPDAWNVAEQLLDEPITGLPFQGVREVTIDGVGVTVSRTGFTGEFGFKVLCPTEHAVAIWNKAATTATPIGHEALEVAMTEFRQPVLHREATGVDATVIAAGLNWLVDLEKEDFVGRDALLEQRDAGSALLPVCFVTSTAVDAGASIGAEGEELGRIVHVVSSPGVGAWCGVAQVQRDCAAAGLVFSVLGSDATVRTMSAPIVIPTSWGALVSAMAGSEVEA